MAVQTFIHISGTKLSDGFLPPTASSESSECCDWGSICTGLNFVCVRAFVFEKGRSRRVSLIELRSTQSCAKKEVTAGPWGFSTQPFNMYLTYTHIYVRTYILCVNKEPNPLFDSSIRPPTSSNMGMRFPCLYRALWVKGTFIYICHTF